MAELLSAGLLTTRGGGREDEMMPMRSPASCRELGQDVMVVGSYQQLCLLLVVVGVVVLGREEGRRKGKDLH